MFKNYFKLAWRNLIKNLQFTFLNLIGLSTGLACAILIYLWVSDEMHIDKFNDNDSRLYQVMQPATDGNEALENTPGLLASSLAKEMPEVEYAASVIPSTWFSNKGLFSFDNTHIRADGQFVSKDYFNIFSCHFIDGDKSQLFAGKNNIAVSKELALRLFGTTNNVIGKTIEWNQEGFNDNYVITGVFEKFPSNSTIQFDAIFNYAQFFDKRPQLLQWDNNDPSTYLLLKKGVNVAQFNKKLAGFLKTKNAQSTETLFAQRFSDTYLYNHYENGVPSGGRIEYVRLFSIIAVFILLIACINFMNLATARSAKRAKEVGIRKVVGALRSALIIQFVGEAVLITFFSIIIAIILAALLLPAFNGLTGNQLVLPFNEPIFWTIIVGLLVITGFVAGSYPALFLSSLKPVRVLKGSLKFSWREGFFRKALVVFQFTLSIFLIIGTIVVYRQVNYIQTKNLGYDRNNLVYIPIEGDLVKNYDLFKQEATTNTDIVNVSKMRNSPTEIFHHTTSIEWPGKDPNLSVSFADGVVGYDFVRTMNLQLQAGRDFSKDFGTDSVGFLLNETAVRKIGFKNAVGKTITWGNHRGRVIGVLKDFHFNSMHEAIEPLIMRLDENWNWGTILVRIKAGKTKEAIADLQKICKELNQKFPFTYQFSDLEYAKLYTSEAVVSKLANIFAFLAIFISCLGLFGLATFTAEQRTKEIGVRKVLGASVPNIISLLSTNFLKPVILAFFIAFPVAWYVMSNWLRSYAYKIDIGWWMFALAGLLTVCIAMLTVSYQSIKAAVANPVKSLRTE